MAPDIFISSFERVDLNDKIYGIIGRALTISTRFEHNCKIASSIDAAKNQRLISNRVKSEEDIIKTLTRYYRKTLNEHLNALLGADNDIKRIFDEARKARNEIVHEFTKGMTELDTYSMEEVAHQLQYLKELVEKLAFGDLIICFITTQLTNEELPNQKFLLAYRDNVVKWVMEA
jgi:hypothetical protein